MQAAADNSAAGSGNTAAAEAVGIGSGSIAAAETVGIGSGSIAAAVAAGSRSDSIAAADFAEQMDSAGQQQKGSVQRMNNNPAECRCSGNTAAEAADNFRDSRVPGNSADRRYRWGYTQYPRYRYCVCFRYIFQTWWSPFGNEKTCTLSDTGL